jgi:hypothetical protein
MPMMTFARRLPSEVSNGAAGRRQERRVSRTALLSVDGDAGLSITHKSCCTNEEKSFRRKSRTLASVSLLSGKERGQT